DRGQRDLPQRDHHGIPVAAPRRRQGADPGDAPGRQAARGVGHPRSRLPAGKPAAGDQGREAGMTKLRSLTPRILIAVCLAATGLFGFTEHGWQPAPQAALTVVAESVVLVVLAVPLLRWVRARKARSKVVP